MRAYGKKVFSRLDLTDTFYCIRVHPKDSHKLAFTLGSHFLQPKGSAQGFKNTPAHMTEVNDPVREAFSFFDDAVAASVTKLENLATLRELFQSMEKHEMYLNLAKCEFFKSEFTFLG